MTLSDKNKTNRKWLSTDDYKENYDRIFSQESDEKDEPKTKEVNDDSGV